jgi:DNA-directed RNA polymerase beta subunit
MKLYSDKEIEDRVSSPENLVNKLHIHEIERGRGGSPNVPIEIKKVAAIIVNSGGTNKEVSKAFGIDNSAITRYGKGIGTSHGELPIPELKEVVQSTKNQNQLNRETAESSAISTLLQALKVLPSAIANTTKAKDLSSVAKDLAGIANQMNNSDDKDGLGSKALHLHIYRPRMKDVNEYDVIDV